MLSEQQGRLIMETVLKTAENVKKCLCGACPSYTAICKIKNYPINALKVVEGIENIDHFEKLFCAFGKSNCISENRGCLCEQCDVYSENNLTKEDYCLSFGGVDCSACKITEKASKKH